MTACRSCSSFEATRADLLCEGCGAAVDDGALVSSAYGVDEPKPTLVTKSTVLDRGWTEGAVRRFLGDPDCKRPNPHRKAGPPMQLFAIERVIAAESSPGFLAWKERSDATRAASRERMVRRQAEIRAESVCWAESVDISPPVRHPLADVVHAARNAWETRKMEFGNYDASTDDAGQDFLDRIAVNFLRHRMTDYDAMLRERFGLAGVDDAARIIRRRVLAAIAAAYPELRAECERQESTR